MVDLIADYLSNIRSRRTFPDVEPGYMKNLVPDTAPENGEDWEDVVRDIERVIMPGVRIKEMKPMMDTNLVYQT